MHLLLGVPCLPIGLDHLFCLLQFEGILLLDPDLFLLDQGFFMLEGDHFFFESGILLHLHLG